MCRCPYKRPPCVKGDSPQCGEMSRSDRGARARRAGCALAQTGGLWPYESMSMYRQNHNPSAPSGHLPLHKGGFWVLVGANSVRPCSLAGTQDSTGAYRMLPYAVGADSISARQVPPTRNQKAPLKGSLSPRYPYLLLPPMPGVPRRRPSGAWRGSRPRRQISCAIRPPCGRAFPACPGGRCR